MLSLVNKIESSFDYEDMGKLVLRVSFAVMMLLHGLAKVNHGTAYIEGLLVQNGLPAFVAYGVYLGEVIAPLMVAIGLYTRIGSGIVIGTCLFIVGLAHMDNILALGKHGQWAMEGVGVYLFAAIAVLLMGSGKYAVKPS